MSNHISGPIPTQAGSLKWAEMPPREQMLSVYALLVAPITYKATSERLLALVFQKTRPLCTLKPSLYLKITLLLPVPLLFHSKYPCLSILFVLSYGFHTIKQHIHLAWLLSGLLTSLRAVSETRLCDPNVVHKGTREGFPGFWNLRFYWYSLN